MDISFMDNLAVNGNGYLHRSNAWSKLLLITTVLTTVILSNYWAELLIMTGLLVGLLVIEQLPFLQLLPFLSYPLFFSALFALITKGWTATSILILLKTLTATLGLLTIISTTTYGDIFKVLSIFLPRIITDGLFMTYRCFFMLLGELDNYMKILKLRGGYEGGSFLRNISRIASSLGIIFIHAWERAERMYSIMSLRGYQGHIHFLPDSSEHNLYNLWPIAWAIICAGVVITL